MKNWKSKLFLAIAAAGTAAQLTIAELQDMYDDSAVTTFQPDLLIQAWGAWLMTAIAITIGLKRLDNIDERVTQITEEKK
jgi:hypothetical protein